MIGIITALFLYQAFFWTLFFLDRFFDISAIVILNNLNLTVSFYKQGAALRQHPRMSIYQEPIFYQLPNTDV